VFNLTTLDSESTQTADKEPAPSQDETATPTDAAGYARRAAALAARKQYERAVAAFNKAIELDPANGKYFLQRGEARLVLQRGAEAMSDFNEALRVNPTDIDARLARAELHIAEGDAASARTDLAVADKTAAAQAGSRWDIGLLYMRLHDLAAAIIQYDKWIAAHNQDVGLPEVQNDRCWARALLGTELDKALDDCNAALYVKPESAAYLDSRGLVYLRQGRLDKALADYDAALKTAPKQTWSLYGRGLAHLRKGETGPGSADITAAKAIRPSIEDDAKKYGIGP
jgi:tetratricopeptide (TPR) repeat protein